MSPIIIVLNIVLITMIVLSFTYGYFRLPIVGRKAPGYFEYTVDYINNILKTMNFLIENGDDDETNENMEEWYNEKLLYDKISKLLYRWHADLKVIRTNVGKILEFELNENINDKFLTDIFVYLNNRPGRGIYVTSSQQFIEKFRKDKKYNRKIVKVLTSIFVGKINDFLEEFDEETFIKKIVEHSKNNIFDNKSKTENVEKFEECGKAKTEKCAYTENDIQKIKSGDDILSSISEYVRTDTDSKNRLLFDKLLSFQKYFVPYTREYTCSGFTNIFLFPVALTKLNIYKNSIRRQLFFNFIKSGNLSINGFNINYDAEKNILVESNTSGDIPDSPDINIIHKFEYKTIGEVLVDYLNKTYPSKSYEIKFSSKSKVTDVIGIVNNISFANINALLRYIKPNANTAESPEDLDIVIINNKTTKEERKIIADSMKEQLYPIINASYTVYNYEKNIFKENLTEVFKKVYEDSLNINKGRNTVQFPEREYPIFADSSVITKKDEITDDDTKNINNVYVCDVRKTGYKLIQSEYENDKEKWFMYKHNYHGRRREFLVDWDISKTHKFKVMKKECDLRNIKSELINRICVFFTTFKEKFGVNLFGVDSSTGLTLSEPERLQDILILFLVPHYCAKADTKGLSSIRYILEEIEAPKVFIKSLDKHLSLQRISESIFTQESADDFQECLEKLYEVMYFLREYRIEIQKIRNPKRVRRDKTTASTLDKIEISTFNYDDNKLNILLLDMYLNTYLVGPLNSDKCLQKAKTAEENKDNFESMFDTTEYTSLIRMTKMRTVGGPFNMELMKIYSSDLTKYVFKDKYNEIWKEKKIYKGVEGHEVKEVLPIIYYVYVVRDFMIAEKTLKFFWNMPAFVTGSMDRFKNNEHFNEDYMNSLLSSMERYYDQKYNNSGKNNTGEEDGEVVETFVGAIINIGKAFLAIGEVFLSIVNVITDPVSFILFLICWIVSLVLFFVWILLYLLWTLGSGYILVSLGLLILTWLWYGVWFTLVVILAIVAVIDAFLGNFILKSLRCENYPDAWHTMHNFIKGNQYTRSIFCFLPCVKGYFPRGIFCYKRHRSYPLYAPHQVIFNTYLRNDFISTAPGKKRFQERPNFRTYSVMSNEERFVYWKESFARRDDFLDDSITFYEDYENLIEATCQHLLSDGKMKNEVDREELRYMCQSIFCKGNVDNSTSCKTPVKVGNNYDKDSIWIIFLKLLALVLVVYLGLASITGTSEDEKDLNKNNILDADDDKFDETEANIKAEMNEGIGMGMGMGMMGMMSQAKNNTSHSKPAADAAAAAPAAPTAAAPAAPTAAAPAAADAAAPAAAPAPAQ